MKHYGIADIGSNTMVLIVYHMEDGTPVQDKYLSTPVHLIQYVDDSRHMSQDGIRAAQRVLLYYDTICDSMNCDYKWADITEPCRITNLNELTTALEETGFTIFPLSGEQEASNDFLGAKLAYPGIHSGAAFDVGGGSTELIVFENDLPLAAASFPLGCVRLAKLPLDNEDCRREILRTQIAYPALRTTAKTMIGIGGTARSVCRMIDALYGTGQTMSTKHIKELYTRLCREEPVAVDTMKKIVDASRQPVFLPGIHMILEILDVYEAETVLFSPSGIREGFLLSRIAECSES